LEVSKAKWMRQAIRLSVKNARAGKGGPFAALVVKENRIVARGTNVVTSRNDPTAHAEITAIRKACRALGRFALDGCELYATCEPCPMCWGAIYWARLDRVYYAATRHDAAGVGFDDEKFFEELKRPYSEQSIPVEQIMQTEALEAFALWAQKPDKIPY
jgi:guanine deaminase